MDAREIILMLIPNTTRFILPMTDAAKWVRRCAGSVDGRSAVSEHQY